MFSESVAQKPTIAVSPGMKAPMKLPMSVNFEGWESMGPKPSAFTYAQMSSARPTTMRNGAEYSSRNLMDSVPLTMKYSVTAQNTANPSSSPGWTPMASFIATELSGS